MLLRTAVTASAIPLAAAERVGRRAITRRTGVTAADVAKSAVEGMAKGRLVVIPGKVNRVAAALSQVTPRTLLLPVLAKGHPGLR